MLELLTTEEMAEADRLTITGGVPGYTLMKKAGRVVFEAIRQRWTPRPVLVVCGPGNNGGDGFVIARELVEAGWPVQLASIVMPEKLGGDARLAVNDWHHKILVPADIDWDTPGLIVDAVFGAGLSRPITDESALLVQKMNTCAAPVIAVDIPSGVDGDTGEVQGVGIAAALTVTFFRAKPGHFLHPGKANCGELLVRDIGIEPEVLAGISPDTFINREDLWRHHFPWPDAGSHKYRRGSALVCSGGAYESGAARLGAMAALRCGAGIVTVLSPTDAMAVNACHLTEVMLRQVDDAQALASQLADPRVGSVLIGPGVGVGPKTAEKVQAVLAGPATAVLDADAITSFEAEPEKLFSALRPQDILTPHEGEFSRLFGDIREDRLTAVRDGAKRAGCVVLLKGDDTVVAAPDGRAVINTNGSPWLATAGSGDVLAGIITGLVAQDMPSFGATCAGVWLHAVTGDLSGPGTIAGDLVSRLPQALRDLF